MNYYKHNIGDYRRDTAHLSLLEHGIYRQMLDQYYLDENPLTGDLDKLMRSLCVRTDDERKAVNAILSDFFALTEKGYIHKRCERELEVIYEKSEKARQSAKRRWIDKNQEVTEKYDANALRTVCDEDANGMLPTTHNPLPITEDTNKNMFILFWEAYPKKVDKKKAEIAFNRMSKTNQNKAIADCKTRFLKTDKQYIPFPRTYLNGERWNDEIIEYQEVVTNETHKQHKHGQSERQRPHKPSLAERLEENRKRVEQEIDEQSMGEDGLYIRP